ncbi:hypothetical protein GCM10011533_33940 [Streptosporangium jomthongense]|uniref:DUF3375 family protein n=1 Tax=Marinobacter aromaticivorans TaxID=1494078 RepID=A0ABW2IZB9_9GAMM|nr:DUF3375 family protein [Marinobacter aromaticivorans]GGE78832.1 hypothetical protein GCM10011533_33940 [Streptosporangium jomthongense]
MDEQAHLRTRSYLVARHQHPAWKLLSATRGPLVLSCLQALLEQNRNEILLEDAQQMLTVFENYAKERAVKEPQPAPAAVPSGLNNNEAELYNLLLQSERGRLEQEFLPSHVVHNAIYKWIAI